MKKTGSKAEAEEEPKIEAYRPSNLDLTDNSHFLKRTNSEKMDDAMKSKRKGNLR
jgi:hypothetical protein